MTGRRWNVGGPAYDARMDGMTELDLDLPKRAERWWEVSAELPDGDAPVIPESRADVMGAHIAKRTILMVRAAKGSVALATVEELLPGLGDAEWRVKPAPVREVKIVSSPIG